MQHTPTSKVNKIIGILAWSDFKKDDKGYIKKQTTSREMNRILKGKK